MGQWLGFNNGCKGLRIGWHRYPASSTTQQHARRPAPTRLIWTIAAVAAQTASVINGSSATLIVLPAEHPGDGGVRIRGAMTLHPIGHERPADQMRTLGNRQVVTTDGTTAGGSASAATAPAGQHQTRMGSRRGSPYSWPQPCCGLFLGVSASMPAFFAPSLPIPRVHALRPGRQAGTDIRITRRAAEQSKNIRSRHPHRRSDGGDGGSWLLRRSLSLWHGRSTRSAPKGSGAALGRSRRMRGDSLDRADRPQVGRIRKASRPQLQIRPDTGPVRASLLHRGRDRASERSPGS